ncbi:hypothetical protein SO3561_00777 [Streptomyces olivochromogenes]|uniref:Uncharacterized protein n=2 Tax=Streptomyces olivochromogenes TaxID=1963 RepID=A0A250V5A2_STROL|nr:hypothetical protein SO3561_00777 [Streptomyces olivochromogenes]
MPVGEFRARAVSEFAAKALTRVFGPYAGPMDDASMVGLMGRVTGTVGPGLVGEVIVRVRGGAEHFLAYPAAAQERIERGTVVMVVEYLPPRTVYVSAAYDS